MSDLTANEARASVTRAKTAGVTFAEEVVRQVEGRAWLSLGYVSWDDMRQEEYGDFAVMLPRAPRQELAAAMRRAGQTQQSIADTAGVSVDTIQRDLKAADAVLTGPIQTSRGERPATYATQTPAPADAGEADAGAGLALPVSPAMRGLTSESLPRGEAGTYSSDVDAVGALASEVLAPAAASPDAVSQPAPEHEGSGRSLDAPRPQVSPLEAIVRDHEENSLSAWRKNYMGAIARATQIFLWNVDDVAEKADHELMTELRRLVTDLDGYASRVEAKRPGLTVLRGGAQR